MRHCNDYPIATRTAVRVQVFEKIGAGNEIRTRDPDLGKVVLYQLSYSRFRRPVLSSVWSVIGNQISGFAWKTDPQKQAPILMAKACKSSRSGDKRTNSAGLYFRVHRISEIVRSRHF